MQLWPTKGNITNISVGKDSECGQPDDKKNPEEGAPSTSKKRKLLDYDTDPEETVRKPQAILEGRELWECFYRLGTEMIITKSGRYVELFNGIAGPL